MGILAAESAPKHVVRRYARSASPTLHREEPKELDSDNEAVAHMHEGIRRILSKAGPKTVASQDVPEDEKHILHCSKILKINVERKSVTIVVEKSEGGLRQVRIEASED